MQYDRLEDWLYLLAVILDLLFLWLIISTGASRWMRDRAEAIVKIPFFNVCIYWLMLSILSMIVFLPLGYYSGFVLEHAHHLSNESLGAWMLDRLKGWAVGVCEEAPVAGLLLWLIGRSPRRWGAWFAAALVPIIAVGIFLEPVLIDPIFNKFTPLPVSSPLYVPLHALANKAGIPGAEILVADKSKQTNETNAYVTGLGSSTRIVLWDTLINTTPKDEIVATTAHEMGHYVEHHIVIGFGLTVVALFIVLPLIQRLAESLLRICGSRWRLRGLTDPAALPVLLLTLNLVTFLTDPISNAFSREIEHRADAFGLGLTGNRMAFAHMFAHMSQLDLEDPNPPVIVKLWLDDHPTVSERVRFALYGQPDSWP